MTFFKTNDVVKVQTRDISPSGKHQSTNEIRARNIRERAAERFLETGRTKKHRDQFTDWTITHHLFTAKENNTEPKCPSPRSYHYNNKPKQLLTNAQKSDIKILQRPKSPTNNIMETIDTPFTPQKSLTERQEEYARVRAAIFETKENQSSSTHKYPP